MNYLFLIIVLAVIVAILAIASFGNFELDSEHYDRLKWVVIRWSYIVVFIGVIAKTFNIPYGTETVTIVAAIGAMLAGLMNISSKSFYEPIPMDIEGMKYLDAEEDEIEGEEVNEQD